MLKILKEKTVLIKMLNKILQKFGRKIIKVNSEYHLPWPTSFSTVDIAVMSKDKSKLLLGRKPGKDYWVFPGGFCDPSSESDQEDAIRELFEETNIRAKVSELKYIGNYNIEDLRYINTQHKIRTHFYMVIKDEKTCGANAGDDLEMVYWFDIEELILHPDIISPRHLYLFRELLKKIGR